MSAGFGIPGFRCPQRGAVSSACKGILFRKEAENTVLAISYHVAYIEFIRKKWKAAVTAVICLFGCLGIQYSPAVPSFFACLCDIILVYGLMSFLIAGSIIKLRVTDLAVEYNGILVIHLVCQDMLGYGLHKSLI